MDALTRSLFTTRELPPSPSATISLQLVLQKVYKSDDGEVNGAEALLEIAYGQYDAGLGSRC